MRRVTGTLGVLLKAKDRGLIAKVKPVIEAIRENGFHVSEPVVGEVLRLADESQD